MSNLKLVYEHLHRSSTCESCRYVRSLKWAALQVLLIISVRSRTSACVTVCQVSKKRTWRDGDMSLTSVGWERNKLSPLPASWSCWLSWSSLGNNPFKTLDWLPVHRRTPITHTRWACFQTGGTNRFNVAEQSARIQNLAANETNEVNKSYS